VFQECGINFDVDICKRGQNSVGAFPSVVLTLENDSFDIFETDESFIKIPFFDETLKEKYHFSISFRHIFLNITWRASSKDFRTFCRVSTSLFNETLLRFRLMISLIMSTAATAVIIFERKRADTTF